jgi:predicted secreted protein
MSANAGTYTGESGTVEFGTDSSQAVVASVRSFTIDQETQTIEDTVMGSVDRTYKAGLSQFSGSMDVYFRDDNSTQVDLFNAIGSDDTHTINLYPSGSTTGIKLSGNIVVTGHSISSNFDGMVEASITFQGSGALTRTVL